MLKNYEHWNRFYYRLRKIEKVMSSFETPSKLTNSFELLIILQGKGHMLLEEESFLLHRYDAFFIHPSQVYQIQTPSESLDYFVCTFDIFSDIERESHELHKLVDTQVFPLKGKQCLINFFQIEEIIDNIYSIKGKAADQLYFRRLLFEQLLWLMIQQKKGSVEKDTIMAIEETKEYIEHNFQQNLSNERLAAMADLSPKYYSTLFKKEYGFSVSEYITRLRVNEAKRLLAKGEEKVRHIAAQVGYSDEFYLSRKFKQVVGLAPSTYRNKRKRRVAAYDFSTVGHLLALHIVPYAAPIHPKWTSYYYQTLRNDISVHLSAFQINKDWENNIQTLIQDPPDLIISKDRISEKEKQLLSKIAPVIYYSASADWKEQLLYIAERIGEVEEANEWLHDYEGQVRVARKQWKKHAGHQKFLPLRFFQGQLFFDHSRTITEVFYGDLQVNSASYEKNYIYNSIVSLPELEKIKPDCILLNVCQESNTLDCWNEFREDYQWNNLEAVRLQKVYQIASDPWREYSASSHERVLKETLTLTLMEKVQQ
ncbi:helix-turn-helix domain-containing protein [Bacillus sp. AFS040349]|uniref:helix-turn-helix domain-containing protein n=1 Tax=Bacillus sp. AFS040349 TaxID=2033502 RepID=UPI000BFB3A75|nr:helix-turn-helix domain-containing protein [Bacillus sp. AFS040349]PGT76570.1 AraC family transcriptional regulator [Bacillus sp. AFS040349]